jgi:transposase
VAGGIWVSNEQLAYRIDVGVPTIERWRKRLERAGYLRCELVRPRFRKMWLVNMNAVRREQTLVEAPASSAVN